ncbi:uncharacterized protein F4812DRAFT_457437 [Daldinia caldariorum]|uniref:uncharacterized protein n=1 Tax=Daldinia caldariorum TaxID=326644 RepID=UPI0020079518|nr:uncharacterized protein F4812DRAFT_457437 [Daldinia caldariorum]KAI1470039.1 hypothetical protein F4812DRAFT_457437 [Daldinia caldariorum]
MAENELEGFPALSISVNEKELLESKEILVTVQSIGSEDSDQPVTTEASPETSPPRTPPPTRMVADLAEYIEACYYPKDFPPEKRTPIFNNGEGHYRPQLRQGRVNRILLYPGIFSPPHLSHQAMVNCAFAGCQDLNVIAAIVIPIGNRITWREFSRSATFDNAQRVRLWRGDDGPHDWLWIFDWCPDGWDTFCYMFKKKMTMDFDVEFLYLGGPDHIGKDYVTDCPWDSTNLIVSDIGREADFVKEDGTLHDLVNYESWQTPDIPEGTYPKKAEEMPPWLIDSLAVIMPGDRSDPEYIEKLYQGYMSRISGTRSCKGGPKRKYSWVRFILAGENPKRVSATDVRRTISETPTEELLEKIKDIVMNPEAVVEMMDKLRKSGPLSSDPESSDEEELDEEKPDGEKPDGEEPDEEESAPTDASL